jgi:hypothetical protein
MLLGTDEKNRSHSAFLLQGVNESRRVAGKSTPVKFACGHHQELLSYV